MPATLLQYVLAALPILIVLGLMVALRWGGQRAGPAGWLAGVVVALLAFGLNFDVFWVSQAKGVLLALFVLAVLWPALLLYNLVARAGGIQATAQRLESLIADRGLLLIVMAWAFSGMLEGLAGFGVPIAIVAPMLVSLGTPPVLAVAAVAVGHSWSITFGDMGVIYQTLIAVTGMDGVALAPWAALLLGAACLGCGLAAARLLGQGRRWREVVVLALIMAVTQYLMVAVRLTSLGALIAGLSGVVGGWLLSRLSGGQNTRAASDDSPRRTPPALVGTVVSYGALTALLTAIVLIQPVNTAFNSVLWRPLFPEVVTQTGILTAAGPGQIFRPLTHPGSALFLIACLTYLMFRRMKLVEPGAWRAVFGATWRSAAPASVGIFAMVGLSTLMEHTGMTQLLAQGLSQLLGVLFPLVSPLVGMLGAFATGSNNNSNVLFAPLQQQVAALIGVLPAILVAAQTTGGALGSMIAPAKILVGCSTVGLKGEDGAVLRRTLPYGLLIGLVVGVFALILSVTRSG